MNILHVNRSNPLDHRLAVIHGVLLVALAFFQIVQAQTPRPGDAGDLKKDIIGTWEGSMVDTSGAPQGAIKLVITASLITASNPRGGQDMGAGTYKISSSTNKLKHIDAKGTSGQFARKSYQGIITIEGNTLKWCSANDNPNSKRPTALETKPQQGQFLMVLEKKS